MAVPLEVETLVRWAHELTAIVWLGFLYFFVYVRPVIFARLTEDTQKQVLPVMAKAIRPWLFWSSLLTILLGLALHVIVGTKVEDGFKMIPMSLNIGILLAIVMLGIGHAMVLPTLKRVGAVLDGGKMPPKSELDRAMKMGRISALLSVVVLFLMVFGSHLPSFLA